MNETVANFKWYGINKAGKRIRGTIASSDINNAQIDLIGQGIEIIDIKQYRDLSKINIWEKSVKPKEVADFSRFLSTMISAGVPIIQSFDIILKDQKESRFKEVIQTIRHDVTAGETLSTAFRKHPKLFDELYCNLVKAGEKSGTLETIFKRLADHLEELGRLKSKLKRAMIYPTMIVLVSVAVSLILLIFVVPQFEQIFGSAGAKLPAFTALIINVSKTLRHDFILFIAVILLIYYTIKYVINNYKAARYLFDKMILKIWIVGDLIQKIMVARFTDTLSVTLEAGLPIIDSMKSMADIMTNVHFKNGILKTSEGLTRGRSLSASLSEFKLMPIFLVQMVTIGESSGRLPEMLRRVGAYYESEINNSVENLANIIEPLIIVILGIIVGSFVIAMYLPIFKLGSLA